MTKPEKLSAQETMEFLRRIDAGEETCVGGGQDEWDDMYAGDVEFLFASGWKLIVFNDCQEWDYVGSVVAPDGREFEYGDGEEFFDVERWEPSERGLKTLRMIDPGEFPPHSARAPCASPVSG